MVHFKAMVGKSKHTPFVIKKTLMLFIEPKIDMLIQKKRETAYKI